MASIRFVYALKRNGRCDPVRIDLRLLRHALALAEHRSFQRAADALHTSQPSLSRGIAELEDRVGLPLFTRLRSGVEPTDFGRLFLEHAREIMDRTGDLEREVGLAKGLRSGEVSVGVGAYVLSALPRIFAPRFAAAHPGIRLRVVLDSPAALPRMLSARTLDLVVADRTVLGEAKDLDVLARLPPVSGWVVVRAGHPLARAGTPTFTELLDYPYAQVVMLPPRLLKPILKARHTRQGSSPEPQLPFPAVECATAELALDIVAGSDAFTFSLLHPLGDALEQGRLVPLMHLEWLQTAWNVVRLRHRTASPAMIALVREIERANADLAEAEAKLVARWRSPGRTAPGNGARRRPRRT
jgi:DNA-binding transcriptional LysR family regulator